MEHQHAAALHQGLSSPTSISRDAHLDGAVPMEFDNEWIELSNHVRS